jgi:hypothetical protein
MGFRTCLISADDEEESGEYYTVFLAPTNVEQCGRWVLIQRFWPGATVGMLVYVPTFGFGANFGGVQPKSCVETRNVMTELAVQVFQ